MAACRFLERPQRVTSSPPTRNASASQSYDSIRPNLLLRGELLPACHIAVHAPRKRFGRRACRVAAERGKARLHIGQLKGPVDGDVDALDDDLGCACGGEDAEPRDGLETGQSPCQIMMLTSSASAAVTAGDAPL